MKVTKILALAAVAVMGCAVFYGCGETTGSSSPTSSTVSSQADVASQTTSQSSEADTPVPPKDTRIVGTWKADHLIVDKKAVSVREWATAQLEQEMEIPSDIPDSLSSQMNGLRDTLVEEAVTAFENASLEFRADGTYFGKANMMGKTMEENGTYKMTDRLVLVKVDGQFSSYAFDPEAGTLTDVNADMIVVMKKQ